ncbi:hypothetical protein GCK72_006745 [Caenorhabditis remanei]|uniref:Uncharacterized protein n=1 Tax=Caenorhabditis remanei TaxID=31234 RepID=A0A6A5HJK7_CAERE|nr:hypothetical protein GCK72_006745 [Caenorhabditis remanei]KAF1766787.1 hypothetical protein GCK72_006745 [Caenorhabditis remanei]
MGYIGVFSQYFRIPSEIQFYLAMCCYGGIASAGILIFENRQHHMIPKGYKFRIQKPVFRVMLVVFNYFLGMFVMVMAIWLRADSDDLKYKFLKLNPCPDPLYFTTYTFAVDSNRNEFSICIAIVLSLVSLQYSFFITHCIWYIYSEEAARYSRSTRKMQKMFLFASFSQLAIFMTVFVIPLGVFALILTTGFRNQGLLNICNLIIPTIGINTTIGLVVMYKPYRDFLIKKLKNRRADCGMVNSPSAFTKSVVV